MFYFLFFQFSASFFYMLQESNEAWSAWKPTMVVPFLAMMAGLDMDMESNYVYYLEKWRASGKGL